MGGWMEVAFSLYTSAAHIVLRHATSLLQVHVSATIRHCTRYNTIENSPTYFVLQVLHCSELAGIHIDTDQTAWVWHYL